MPGPCQRLRLPSLASVIRTSRPDYSTSTLRKEKHRVVVMGTAKVGKSCIISQFLYDKYICRYRQTIEELHRGEYELPDGASLTLDILDTSGAFEFPAMRALSISTAGAFLLVFAVDDEDSWNEVSRLRKQIVDARGFKAPIVIVANKTDLPSRKLRQEVTESIATIDWKCGYVECSAKENAGIIEVFKELLVQSNIHYNLSPAVRRRRQSLPNYSTESSHNKFSITKQTLKRHSCTVA